jgi:hypothetical protein
MIILTKKKAIGYFFSNREEGKKEGRPNRNAWRRLYCEKTVRKAERAWFLSGGEENESRGINGDRPHFLYVVLSSS